MKSKLSAHLLSLNFCKCQDTGSALQTFIFSICLSWVYALCAQCIIPIPFNLVPIYPLPMPIFLCVFMFGWPAVYALLLYVTQGALGLPFFSAGRSGLIVLMGPRGGYIFGFIVASVLLMLIRSYRQNSLFVSFFKVWMANVVVFACGLAQLAFFVSSELLLQLGFYPFLIGDFIVKTGIILFVLNRVNKSA